MERTRFSTFLLLIRTLSLLYSFRKHETFSSFTETPNRCNYTTAFKNFKNNNNGFIAVFDKKRLDTEERVYKLIPAFRSQNGNNSYKDIFCLYTETGERHICAEINEKQNQTSLLKHKSCLELCTTFPILFLYNANDKAGFLLEEKVVVDVDNAVRRKDTNNFLKAYSDNNENVLSAIDEENDTSGSTSDDDTNKQETDTSDERTEDSDDKQSLERSKQKRKVVVFVVLVVVLVFIALFISLFAFFYTDENAYTINN